MLVWEGVITLLWVTDYVNIMGYIINVGMRKESEIIEAVITAHHCGFSLSPIPPLQCQHVLYTQYYIYN